MASQEKWEIYGQEWLRSLKDIAVNHDPDDPDSRMTTFEMNLLRDLKHLLNDDSKES